MDEKAKHHARIERDHYNRRREEPRFNLLRRFKDMKLRCYNPKHPAYRNYGERGIIICQEWLDDPEAFVQWAMENGYEKELQVDRINNEGPYGPDNCRWVTQNQQNKNRRKSYRKKAQRHS